MVQKNNNLKVGMSVFGVKFFILGIATNFIITLSAPVKKIFRLSEFAAQLLSSASGIIIALIIGGAIITPIMGSIADNAGYTWAFIVPAICYLYIFFYAIKGNTIRRA